MWKAHTLACQWVVAFASRDHKTATQECPCGFLGSERPCRCTPGQIQRYRGRIGGPLLDRMDLHVEVPALDTSQLPIIANDLEAGEPSPAVAARVELARQRQTVRFADLEGVFANAQLRHEEVPRRCVVDRKGRALLEKAADAFGFSARAVHRCLRVARTIADLEGTDGIEAHHVSEAAQYRVLDRQGEVAG